MADKYIAALAVLEEERIEQIKNLINAEVYRSAKEVLVDEGMDQALIAKAAARITLRVKRFLTNV